jgi:hypothetical protein
MHLNLIMYVLSHALGPTGRYSVLSFHISTVFDINPLELVRFRNSRYFVSSHSFSCPALPFSLSFLYFKCKSRKQFRSFLTISDRFHPYLRCTNDLYSRTCHLYYKLQSVAIETLVPETQYLRVSSVHGICSSHLQARMANVNLSTQA